jgi:hypothetical protein
VWYKSHCERDLGVTHEHIGVGNVGTDEDVEAVEAVAGSFSSTGQFSLRKISVGRCCICH